MSEAETTGREWRPTRNVQEKRNIGELRAEVEESFLYPLEHRYSGRNHPYAPALQDYDNLQGEKRALEARLDALHSDLSDTVEDIKADVKRLREQAQEERNGDHAQCRHDKHLAEATALKELSERLQRITKRARD